MSRVLLIRNRQRCRPIDTRNLRKIFTHCLDNVLQVQSYELAMHFVSDRVMTQTNQEFLQHEGSTDVITFNHRDLGATLDVPELFGEIFICPEEAVRQAKVFNTSWQDEIVRYGIHGLLHLLGYDDVKTSDRRAMKQEENRLVKLVQRL